MYCPNCGEVVSNSATFCSNCGTTVLATAKKTDKAEQGEVKPAATHEYQTLGGFLLVLTICAIISLVIYGADIIRLFNDYQTIKEESRYISYTIDGTDVIKASQTYIVVMIIAKILMGIVLFLHIRAVFKKDEMALKRFEQFVLLVVLSYGVSFFFAYMSYVGGINYWSIIVTPASYFLVCLYYTKSVRVRTYFGSSAYREYSILWKNAELPAPAVPDAYTARH